MPEIPTRLEALALLVGKNEENKRLKEIIVEMRETIDGLQAKIAALEARLAQNSTNSNRPPSSDSPQDRGSRPDRPATGRTRGGQRGHKGLKRNLLPAEKVNETREYYPEICRRPGCGRRLRRRPLGDPLRHQVVDVPAIEPHVTEYRLHSVACDCGKITCAPLPDGVPRGMCGPRLMALIALLTGIYRNSRRDAVKVLSDVLGVGISLGALSEAEARVSEAIAAPVEEARAYVSEQGVKHVDATGWRQAGKGRTLWTIATTLVTVFGITADGTLLAQGSRWHHVAQRVQRDDGPNEASRGGTPRTWRAAARPWRQRLLCRHPRTSTRSLDLRRSRRRRAHEQRSRTRPEILCPLAEDELRLAK